MTISKQVRVGRLCVSSSEAVLSDTAFDQAPDTARLVRNIVDWFMEGRGPRTFIVVTASNCFGHEFARVVAERGCSLELKDRSWLSFENLTTINEQYGGIFIEGGDGGIFTGGGDDHPLPAGLLQHYILQGGSVFLSLEIGFFWHNFLGTFGMFMPNALSDLNLGMRLQIQGSNDFLFAGVENVYYQNGCRILPAGGEKLAEFSGHVPESWSGLWHHYPAAFAFGTVEVSMCNRGRLTPFECRGWEQYGHLMAWSDDRISLVVAYDLPSEENEPKQLYRGSCRVWIKNCTSVDILNVSVDVGEQSHGNRSWDAFLSQASNAVDGYDQVTVIDNTPSLSSGAVMTADFFLYCKHTSGNINDPLDVLLWASPSYEVVSSASGDGPSGCIIFSPAPKPPTINHVYWGNEHLTVYVSRDPSSGPVSHYTVTASPGGKQSHGSVSPITVAGLTNGTAYTLTVTATNASGTSLPSHSSESATPWQRFGIVKIDVPDSSKPEVLYGYGDAFQLVQPPTGFLTAEHTGAFGNEAREDIYAITSEGKLKIWNLEDDTVDERQLTDTSFGGEVWRGAAAVCSPAGDRMYIRMSSGGVAVVDVNSYRHVATWHSSEFSIYQERPFVVSPDGRVLYVLSGNLIVALDTLVLEHDADPNRNPVIGKVAVDGLEWPAMEYYLQVSPDGKYVYAGMYLFGKIAVVDAVTMHVISYVHMGRHVGFALHPEGTLMYVFSGWDASSIKVYNIGEDGIPRLGAVEIDVEKAYFCKFSTDGKRAHVMCYGNGSYVRQLHVIDVERHQSIRRVDIPVWIMEFLR